MAERKPTTRRGSGDAATPKRTSVSELAKMLAERRAAGASSVTLKTSAQGVFMPELTIVANEDPEVITRMVDQARTAYTTLLRLGDIGQ